MSDVKEPNAKKSDLWDTSPLSPQWTITAVFVLVVFSTVPMKIGLSA